MGGAEIRERLDTTTWSFSRVNAFSECKRMWYLTYLEKATQEQNAFAEWGTLCHSLFERYLKGQLELFELADAYMEEYPKTVIHPFPYNKFADLSAKYYERGIEVFSDYAGLPDGLEFVASEQRMQQKIGGRKFIGYIDLILRDKEDGKLIIQDFKSKSGFASKTEQAHYARQLYLYCNYTREKMGITPKLLRFDMFRKGEIVDIPFFLTDFEKANKWFEDSIQSIYEETEWRPKCCAKDRENDFFCQNLCSVRGHCKD